MLVEDFRIILKIILNTVKIRDKRLRESKDRSDSASRVFPEPLGE